MVEHKKVLDKKNELTETQDPLEAYGYGVVAYFSLLENLAYVFAVLSVLAFVLIYLYKTNNYESQNSKLMFGSLTLGNLHSKSKICLT